MFQQNADSKVWISVQVDYLGGDLKKYQWESGIGKKRHNKGSIGEPANTVGNWDWILWGAPENAQLSHRGENSTLSPWFKADPRDINYQ